MNKLSFEEYRPDSEYGGFSVMEGEDGKVYVTTLYPKWDDNGVSKMTIDFNQESVRASSGIQVTYDYKRDGYIIRQQPVKDHGDWCEDIGEPVEVAFIDAFLEVDE